jgi:hypothetical protein
MYYVVPNYLAFNPQQSMLMKKGLAHYVCINIKYAMYAFCDFKGSIAQWKYKQYNIWLLVNL